MPPKPQVIFLTNVLLHRRALFYKFTMFLSKDSLLRYILLRDNAMVRVKIPQIAHAPQNRLPLWTISLALEPADCVLAGNIKG